ncbi:MAG: D-tyrosyl-tRNA(Tyr) deacylase [Ignavibacteria bacterium]|nr:D-tyrosyl-tRNA(Tyr) deacylase [Ignavibacteria bacterium]
MLAVVQRVNEASVKIENKPYSSIKRGLLVFLGIQKGDTNKESEYLSKKIVDLRIFPDEEDKMNLSVRDVKGEIMLISQFTLCTDKNKSGNRPSFFYAEVPEKASKIFDDFITMTKDYYIPERIKSGVFAAMMKIKLLNDGPVTIILERENGN